MKGVILISEGIDSPVAAYMMRKQGMRLVFLHMKNTPDPKEIFKVKKIVEQLDRRGKIIIVDHMNTQTLISDRCNPRYQCILCKRAMYREAETLAKIEGAEYIITGENLGQVASQTLQNLRVLDSAIGLPVLRPLLGLDKNQIIDTAKEIGTYELSTIKSSTCSFVPGNPLTNARLDKVIFEEAKLKNKLFK